jgi:hypothetical protein
MQKYYIKMAPLPGNSLIESLSNGIWFPLTWEVQEKASARVVGEASGTALQ